jgi:opacity protein-like surface antigen
MTKRIAAVGLVLSALLCAPALARFKGGAHWGYMAGDSFLDNDTFGYGVQGGYDVTEYFGVELAGTFFNDNGLGLDIDFTSLSLSLLLGSELPAGFRLYGGGGVSFNLVDVGAGLESDPGLGDEPGYHLCGGLSVLLGDRIELAGEYRHTWISFSQSDHEALESFSFDYSYDMLRLSLSVLF